MCTSWALSPLRLDALWLTGLVGLRIHALENAFHGRVRGHGVFSTIPLVVDWPNTRFESESPLPRCHSGGLTR